MKHLEEVIINYDKKLMEANAEIERLKELCDKYEEEHKTTFETWQKDIKENKLLHSIIKEVRELRKKISNLYYEDGFDLDTPMLLKYIDEILDKENK